MKQLALVLAAASRSCSPAVPVSAADETPRLQRQGRFLVDQHGRVVIVHGLNMVWKRPPYAPPNTAAGFTARDADWLRKYGFNGARIGTLWAGVTPERPGVADPAYFRRVDRVTKLLADRQIWMLFDAHQDMWHEQYGGEGVPDVRGEAADAVRAHAVREGAVPDGLLDPRGLPGLRRLLGEQGQPPGGMGGGLEAGRPALQEPALLDGLRPAQRALGRQGVAVAA